LNGVEQIRRDRVRKSLVKNWISFAAFCARSLLGNFLVVLQQIDLRVRKKSDKDKEEMCSKQFKPLQGIKESLNCKLKFISFWHPLPERERDEKKKLKGDFNWKSLNGNPESLANERVMGVGGRRKSEFMQKHEAFEKAHRVLYTLQLRAQTSRRRIRS
jgi:hypothetical protein